MGTGDETSNNKTEEKEEFLKEEEVFRRQKNRVLFKWIHLTICQLVLPLAATIYFLVSTNRMTCDNAIIFGILLGTFTNNLETMVKFSMMYIPFLLKKVPIEWKPKHQGRIYKDDPFR